MSFKSKLFNVILISICAALIPYIACDLFDAPVAHGIISWDILFLLILLSLPSKKFLWRAIFSVLAFSYAIVAITPADFALALIYIAMIFLTAIPFFQRGVVKIVVFIVFALFAFVADFSVFLYSTFSLFVSDEWHLCQFFWWGPIAFILVPCISVGLQFLFAKKILIGSNSLNITPLKALIVCLLFLGLHVGIGHIQARQPILSFPVKDYVWQTLSKASVSKNTFLHDDIKNAYPQWDDGKNFTSSKPTHFILVESWGVSKNVDYTKLLLSPYEPLNPSFLGLLQRQESHTQGAELEDFAKIQTMLTEGLQTWFVHGYNGDFYDRQNTYNDRGFENLMFKKDFEERGLASCHYGFEGICDSTILSFIDSLMTDSVPKLIYWTTLDAHPPYEGQKIDDSKECGSLNQNSTDCIYTVRQLNTSRQIVSLIKKHPDYRIVIRGDHRPMGTVQKGFVSSFYHRWVPMVVVNE